MFPNVRPSDVATELAKIAPISQGVGTATSSWVSVADVAAVLARISVGVLGAAATVDAKIQQASDSGGTGAKDITGKAITQLVKATDDGKTSFINLRQDELDIANGFTHIRLSITVAGAASLIEGDLLGFYQRFQPKSHAAHVKEAIA